MRWDLLVTMPGLDSRTRETVTVPAVSSAAAIGSWVQAHPGGIVWAWRAHRPGGETIEAGMVIEA